MPAAAVIPAPIAYIKVAAVKKLVVGVLPKLSGPLYERVSVSDSVSLQTSQMRLIARWKLCSIYFEENRVLIASLSFAYASMG